MVALRETDAPVLTIDSGFANRGSLQYRIGHSTYRAAYGRKRA